MGKKSSSGMPYSMPSSKPSYTFEKDAINIKVYYNSTGRVEVYQTINKHTQRMLMSQNDYENFESRLRKNGFTSLAIV